MPPFLGLLLLVIGFVAGSTNRVARDKARICLNDDFCRLVALEQGKHCLHLAILDYEMPMMSGGEVAAFCRAINPDIKVILFSGSLEISSRDLAVADVFIQKPSGIEVLLDAIETLLCQKKEIQGGRTSTAHNTGMDS